MGSFFHKLGSIWHRFFGSAPDWVNHALMTLNYAAPLAVGIMAQVDPEDVPQAQAVVDEIKRDLTNAVALLHKPEGDSTKEKVRDYVLNVKSKLGDLLTAGHIKNPATLTKVKAIADVIIGELDAVLSSIPDTNKGA